MWAWQVCYMAATNRPRMLAGSLQTGDTYPSSWEIESRAMELDSAAIGLLIIVLLIVGTNFVMYAIARGAARGGNSRWMSALKDSLNKPMNTPANQSMDELRKRVEELEREKKAEK